MPPEASVTAAADHLHRPSATDRAAYCRGARRPGLAAIASASCSSVSTSTSILTRWPARRPCGAIACATPPATAMWLSLMRIGVVEAEAVIARRRRSGRRIFRKRAGRAASSACRKSRALVCAHGLDDPGGGRGDAGEMAEEIERDALGREDRARDLRCAAIASPRRDMRAVASATARRSASRDRSAGTPAREGEAGDDARLGARRSTALARASAGMVASEVMSPARPRSSASAARHGASTRSGGTSEDHVASPRRERAFASSGASCRSDQGCRRRRSAGLG